MSPCHLFWIVPLSAIFGYGVAAVLIASKGGED